MRPRKLTATMKAEMARRKECRKLRREMAKEYAAKILVDAVPISFMALDDSTRNIPSVDSGRHNTVKTSIMNDRFKESPGVRAEIERKSSCLAPAYSKGAYQFISDADSAKCAGRKNV